MLNTQMEAHTWINHVMSTVQHARSVIKEAIAGDRDLTRGELDALQFTNPSLFPSRGKVDILEALLKYDYKETITRADIVNVLALIHRDRALTASLEMRDVPLWPPMEFMRDSGLPMMDSPL